MTTSDARPRYDKYGLPLEVEDVGLQEVLDHARRFTVVDGQRVKVWTFAGAVAMEFPRRLGPDATREEMRRDKKISKTVCHSYFVIWNQMALSDEINGNPSWGNWVPAQENDNIRRIGAAVIWTVQIPKLISIAEDRIKQVDLIEPEIKSLRKWQRRRRHMLTQEISSLDRAMALL